MSVFFSKYLPISPFTPKMPVFQTHTHTSQHVSTNHQVFCAEWLASVKRLMIWLSSLLGSSCAWSFRSEHDGDHRWKIHGFGETTTNPQFSRAGRWFLEETWWLWDFCLVDILMDSIHLVSALWRENLLVSGFIAALFLRWRFAGPSQQKTNVFGLQPLNNADVPKIYPLFPSQFVHVSGEPCWLSGDHLL